MSIESGRRAELKKKIDSKKSLNEIIINVLSSEPKTLDGIIKGINERMSECNRRTAPSRKGLIKILGDNDLILGIDCLRSPSKQYNIPSGSGVPVMYGLVDKIESDLRKEIPEDVTYLNRSTHIYLTWLQNGFYIEFQHSSKLV